MSTFYDLEAKCQSLRDQLGAAEVALRAEKLRIAPVKAGDIVLADGKRWRVASVDVRYWHPDAKYGSRPRLSANKQLKDGRFGDGLFSVPWDWKMEMPAPEPSKALAGQAANAEVGEKHAL